MLIADLALRSESQALLDQYSKPAGEGSGRAVFLKTDVTAWDDLRAMLAKAISEFGSFEIVCPGAGIYEPGWSNFWHPPGTDASRDFLDANHYTTLDINITHPIRTTQLALQHWLAPERATQQTPENPKRIIHIASIAGYTPSFLRPLYAASKYAITGFTRSLEKLEPTVGIRVNAVAPGLVQTPLWTDSVTNMALVDEEKDSWITADEVAEAMLLCIEAEDKVGGTILEVGKDTTREVSTFNDPGPAFGTPGSGVMVSKIKDAADVVAKTLQDGSWLDAAAKSNI